MNINTSHVRGSSHFLRYSNKTEKSAVANGRWFISILYRAPWRLIHWWGLLVVQLKREFTQRTTGCRYETCSVSTKEIPPPQHMHSRHYAGSLNWRKHSVSVRLHRTAWHCLGRKKGRKKNQTKPCINGSWDYRPRFTYRRADSCTRDFEVRDKMAW